MLVTDAREEVAINKFWNLVRVACEADTELTQQICLGSFMHVMDSHRSKTMGAGPKLWRHVGQPGSPIASICVHIHIATAVSWRSASAHAVINCSLDQSDGHCVLGLADTPAVRTA